MEKEILETVLTDISEDLRHSNELNKENTKVLSEIKARLDAFEKKFDSTSSAFGKDSISEIEKHISSRFDNLTERLKQPEKIRREFRILLFPEHNTKEYYKVVFGRIIFWLVILVLAKYVYLLGQEWISKEYEDQKYKKAWENLYRQQNKESQKMMQKLLDGADLAI